LVEGDFRVSPGERTIYRLTAFGRDGTALRQQVIIDVQPRQHEKQQREASRKRDKSSPTSGPRVPDSSAGTRRGSAAPGHGGTLQIGIGPAGVRIPIGAGSRAPTPAPKPTRRPIQIGIGRGVAPPD
jgi:hypothetical protein